MAGSFNFYQSWLDYYSEAANMASDTFTVLLTTSSYTPSASTHSLLADITNELSGSGYARQALAGVSSSQTSGVYAFDANDTVFTASGGSITARYWVLFNDTLADDPLVAYGLLDDTPADVTATDGNDLTIQWGANGIIRVTIV